MTPNTNNNTDNNSNNQVFNDREMVRKKEKAINKTERKREIREAVNNNKSNQDCTDEERLTRVERKIVDAENTVDDLAGESLQLARRVVNLGRIVNKEEERLIDFNSRIGRMEEKAADVQRESDKYEIKEDTASDNRTRNILTIIIIIVSSVSSIAIALTFLRGH